MICVDCHEQMPAAPVPLCKPCADLAELWHGAIARVLMVVPDWQPALDLGLGA